MSTTHIGAALNASADLTPTERLLLVILGDYADTDGRAFPSVGRLAERANVSRRTAVRALRRLTVLNQVQQVRTLNGTTGINTHWVLTLGDEDGTAGTLA
ncbi:helix-turn-helix domain-containing protein [Streptomyces sp. NPDC051362]|uniref:helix-turn-helix domain-containing protein n=1 Tax=Streptomyces sp. NPDC051362 TaxID=3365651 RepID=UPI003793F582